MNILPDYEHLNVVIKTQVAHAAAHGLTLSAYTQPHVEEQRTTVSSAEEGVVGQSG